MPALAAYRYAWFFACCFAFVLAAGARASAACATDSALYKTSFSAPDDAWDTGPHMKMGGDKMTIFPEKNHTGTYLYNGDKFTNGTVCADFVMTGTTGDDPSAGIVFWAVDSNNFFMFLIDPLTKHASVGRYKDGKFLAVVDWKPVSTLTGGAPTASHELSVAIVGTHATASVDGAQAASFTASGTPDSWSVGIHGEAASAAPATWLVSNFSIVK